MKDRITLAFIISEWIYMVNKKNGIMKTDLLPLPGR